MKGQKYSKYFHKIKDYLDNSDLSLVVPRQPATVKAPATRAAFIQGHSYRIWAETREGKPSKYENEDRLCVFVFLRKEGKHHVFREARGGWTRTYTDAQLVGKKILEVT